MTTVASGQTVTSTTVSSGQTLDVLSGGTASHITVSYGGTEILDGGTDSTGLIYGAQTVHAGGHALADQLYYGVQTISSGGVASNTDVRLGTQIVLAGGITSDSILISQSYSGSKEVISGGLAVSTTLGLNASMSVAGSGGATGSAMATIVQSGGLLTISGGGTAFSTTLDSGADEQVLVGGATTGTIVLSGGQEQVDGLAINPVLNAGGTLLLEGTAVFTEAAGTRVVENGTLEGSGALIQSGPGTLALATSASSFVGTAVIAGGTLELVLPDAIGNATVAFRGDSGTLRLDTNQAPANITGLGSGTTIDLASLAYASGGTVTVAGSSVTITEGGQSDILTIANVASGVTFALAPDAGTGTLLTDDLIIPIVSAGQTLTISAGHTSAGIELLSGGTLQVLAGGTASATLDFGQENLRGGTEISGLVNGGGVLTVSSGGHASGVTVSSGGSMLVASGGVARGTVLDDSATLNVVANGSATGTVLSGGAGSTELVAGGTDSGAVIDVGVQTLGIGGTAISALVNSGGHQTVQNGGTAIDTTVALGATQTVTIGGHANGTVVHGILAVAAGGFSSGAILSGAKSTMSTYAGSALVNYAYEDITGGVATSTTIGDLGWMELAGRLSAPLSSGATGSAIDTIITAGGLLAVSSGGASERTVLHDSGMETVYAGGLSVSTAIMSGGFQDLTGGFESLTSGATASGAIVQAGGLQLLEGNAVAINDVSSGTIELDGGILEYIEPAGTAMTLSGAVVGGGLVEQEGPGTLIMAATHTTSDTISFRIGGGTLELTSAGVAGNDLVTFTAPNATLQIDSPLPITHPISGFAASDHIDLASLAYTTGGAPSVSGNTVTITQGGSSETLTIDGAAAIHFNLAADATGGTELNAVCYCPGTAILTPTGERPVEMLSIGDLVTTLDGRAEPISWIGRRSYARAFVGHNALMLPVRIATGALADGIPHRDLYVSAGHGLYLGGALIPAWRLINGISITQPAPPERIDYIHIELARHDILLAEGAPAETFLDDDCRGQFANHAEYAGLYPDAPPAANLPRLEHGFPLQAIQHRLARRAGIAIIPPAPGRLRGYIDAAGPDRVTGWAQDLRAPEDPVILDILADGQRIARILANHYRYDLRQAGYGSGCHAFDVALPPGTTGKIEIRRTADGAKLRLSEAAAAA